MQPLPRTLGRFDVVVSALAIHHLPDKRKSELFAEVFDLLAPNGVFYDLDVVKAPSAEIHAISQAAFGSTGSSRTPQINRRVWRISWVGCVPRASAESIAFGSGWSSPSSVGLGPGSPAAVQCPRRDSNPRRAA